MEIAFKFGLVLVITKYLLVYSLPLIGEWMSVRTTVTSIDKYEKLHNMKKRRDAIAGSGATRCCEGMAYIKCHSFKELREINNSDIKSSTAAGVFPFKVKTDESIEHIATPTALEFNCSCSCRNIKVSTSGHLKYYLNSVGQSLKLRVLNVNCVDLNSPAIIFVYVYDSQKTKPFKTGKVTRTRAVRSDLELASATQLFTPLQNSNDEDSRPVSTETVTVVTENTPSTADMKLTGINSTTFRKTVLLIGCCVAGLKVIYKLYKLLSAIRHGRRYQNSLQIPLQALSTFYSNENYNIPMPDV